MSPVANFQTQQAVVETSILYNGDVRLDFSPSGHKYQIFHKGVEKFGTRGVTTVLGVLDKPSLVQWAANECNKYWVDGLSKGPIDEILIATLAKEAPKQWLNTRDKAGQIGTLVHLWIEQWINYKMGKGEKPLTPQNLNMQQAVLKFLQWEKDNVDTYISSEEKVYSLKYNIAGTLDFLYIDKKGVLCLGDLKTSNGIWPTFPLQLAAYRYMLEEAEAYCSPNITKLPTKMVIVRVGKDDGKIQVKEVENYEDNKRAFLACVLLNNILKPLKKWW